MTGGGFAARAETALKDVRLRGNLTRATATIRGKRAMAVGELPDWEELRDAGAAIKARALATLPQQLEALEAAVQGAGGVVHWAADAREANQIVVGVARRHRVGEVVKVKSMATEEIHLNEALREAGVEATETDLAELIVQLAGDRPSHILVPAVHYGREQIRALFEATIAAGETVPDDAGAIADVARRYLRARFLGARMAVSGANFAVAETGTVCVVESEGNGRFCLTVPEVLVTVMGIEKVIAEWRDLEVMLQLLPRSSTGERMNPYTSLWTGVHPGDGPREFHLVLLDNGRTNVLADRAGRDALRCIRCSACLNVCPVYGRTGGHAYASVYPGPIGAVLSPQLFGFEEAGTLPWASSLCGACYEVCPVKIDIPSLLVHLRQRVVHETPGHRSERVAMRMAAGIFGSRRIYAAAQRAARLLNGPFSRLPLRILGGWRSARDLPLAPTSTFRQRWRAHANGGQTGQGRTRDRTGASG
jgi:L-lactate dehydrogenase complex protein LldF